MDISEKSRGKVSSFQGVKSIDGKVLQGILVFLKTEFAQSKHNILKFSVNLRYSRRTFHGERLHVSHRSVVVITNKTGQTRLANLSQLVYTI